MRGERVTLPCTSCGAAITKLKSQIKGLSLFCNRRCKTNYQRSIIPWNKGLTKADSDGLRRASALKLGDLNPMRRPEVRAKSSESHVKCIDSDETRRVKSLAQKRVVTEGRHNFYIDGRSYSDNARAKAYRTVEYRIWRTAVFRRDGWKCQICSDRADIEAHHVKPWRDYPELRYAISNGQTLCRWHHAQIDEFRRKTLSR